MNGDLLQALLNLAIVLFSALALWPVWQMCAVIDGETGQLAAFGGALMLGGGTSLALVRLLDALGQRVPLWMPTNLFGFLTPGFICLSYACFASQQILHNGGTRRPVWLLPLLLIGAEKLFEIWLVGSVAPEYSQPLLIVLTSVASFSFTGLCARAALRLRRPGLSSLFGLYIVAVLAINLAARLDSALALIQALNLLSNAVLAWAATGLSRATSRTVALRRRVALLEG